MDMHNYVCMLCMYVHSQVDYRTKTWICNFCFQRNIVRVCVFMHNNYACMHYAHDCVYVKLCTYVCVCVHNHACMIVCMQFKAVSVCPSLPSLPSLCCFPCLCYSSLSTTQPSLRPTSPQSSFHSSPQWSTNSRLGVVLCCVVSYSSEQKDPEFVKLGIATFWPILIIIWPGNSLIVLDLVVHFAVLLIPPPRDL